MIKMQDLIDDLQRENHIGWTTGGKEWMIKKFKLTKEVKDYIIKHYEELWEDKSIDLDPEGVFSDSPNYDRRIGSELCEELRHNIEQWFMKKYPEGKEVDELEITMEMIGFPR